MGIHLTLAVEERKDEVFQAFQLLFEAPPQWAMNGLCQGMPALWIERLGPYSSHHHTLPVQALDRLARIDDAEMRKGAYALSGQYVDIDRSTNPPALSLSVDSNDQDVPEIAVYVAHACAALLEVLDSDQTLAFDWQNEDHQGEMFVCREGFAPRPDLSFADLCQTLHEEGGLDAVRRALAAPTLPDAVPKAQSPAP